MCFKDCVERDPNETPIQFRAKISLEIYVVAYLQTIAMSGTCEYSHLWAYPTVWDCAIYPNLSYRPDYVFMFGHNNELFEICGACKINAQEISYALQVEIIEESRASHSCHRAVEDVVRELEIRAEFPNIPYGFLYVTVAHLRHKLAHVEDIFFQKNDKEYEVIPSKVGLFETRMRLVCQVLCEMFETRENGTRYIGY